jgi:hypothetical protein
MPAGSPPTFEGFSLSHAAILDGTTGAESASIYAVRNGTLTTDQGSFEYVSDDVVVSDHTWLNFVSVTIEEGFIPFSTLACITGSQVSSSGAAPADYYAIPLWTLAGMNPPTFPLAIRVPSKDVSGTVRTLDFILYRVKCQPFNFNGPSYKTGLSCSIAGRALFSATDEAGNALPASYGGLAIGRLVAWPGAQGGAFTAEPFLFTLGIDGGSSSTSPGPGIDGGSSLTAGVPAVDGGSS